MRSSRDRDLGRLRSDAKACFEAAVAAVMPAARVRAHLAVDGSRLVLHDREGRVAATHEGPVVLVGAGKAAFGMAQAAAAIAGERVREGLVIVPHGGGGSIVPQVLVRTGGHPLPDGAAVGATAKLLSIVEAATADTLVIVVLSGGASSLLTAPAQGMVLADKQQLTERLLMAGADITSLNVVRKHVSRVKGGGLARAAASAAGCWTLALSDVVGDDPATIGSGPTVPDPTTFADAIAVLDRFVPRGSVPPAIRSYLDRGRTGVVAETSKDGHPAFARAHTIVVGSNADAVRAAAAEAQKRGYAPEVVPEPVVGDAGAAGRQVVGRLAALSHERPVALVAGGETTVKVVAGGRGGRNQHLALSAAVMLAGEDAVVLAGGTDGIDGPTDAAGALVDGTTVARAAERGLDAAWALASTDSHTVLAETDDLLVTGATGTNVADLVVALRGPW